MTELVWEGDNDMDIYLFPGHINNKANNWSSK